MSFKQWLHSMTFEFWLGFAFSVIPFLMSIYQFFHDRQDKAAKFFLFGTLCVVGLLIWSFFGGTRADLPVENATASATRTWVIEPYKPWKNAWPSMSRDPDAVRVVNDGFPNPTNRLSMWIEGIVLGTDETIIYLGINNSSDAMVDVKEASGAYIVDDQGESYSLQSEVRFGDGPFPFVGQIRPSTTERLKLIFPPIQTTASIRLVHPQFLPLTLYRYNHSPETVLLCRITQWTGWVYTTRVYCDDEEVASLESGTSENIQMKPGHHSCQAKAFLQDSPPLEIDAHPAGRHYIQIKYDPGLWKTTLLLIPVANETACKN